MISKSVLRKIANIVGEEHLLTRKEALTQYGTDATKLEFLPDAVVFPGTPQEISEIFELANADGFPVIPRGAGTGMSGGALPVQGGLVLVMERFNRILGIDADNLIAKVEAGVITAELQRAAEKVGLFYPPDPASVEVSTLGGNVAECAGGLRAVKYGVTRDYVLGLSVVLPTSEILNTGVETVKGVAGYDLTRLIVGSEGTLALITSIIVRLIPLPASRKTLVAFFREVSGAVQAVSDIIRARIVPTALEFMDRLCLTCAEEESGLSFPKEAQAMLLIEVDGDDLLVEREVEKIQRVLTRSGILSYETAQGPTEAERLWEVRRKASPSLLRLRPHKISEDVVVPRSRLADLIVFLGELGSHYGLPIPAFGHAGDGNIHVNIMLDKGNDRELENAQKVIRELFRRVIDMGGTITGEHGVGITKAPYLSMEIPEAGLGLMARIKRAFDPNGILNPGKIFYPF